jgi:hypothetical protein
MPTVPPTVNVVAEVEKQRLDWENKNKKKPANYAWSHAKMPVSPSAAMQALVEKPDPHHWKNHTEGKVMEKLRAKLAALKAEALHWREKRAQQELADKKIQEELTAQRLAAWHVKHNQNVSAP